MRSGEIRIVATAAAAFATGWAAGAALHGWVAIVAWTLAVFAGLTVVASVLDAAHDRERVTLHLSNEACRRRWREERDARIVLEGKLKLARVEVEDALKALNVAGRMRR